MWKVSEHEVVRNQAIASVFYITSCLTVRYLPYSFKSMLYGTGALEEKSNEDMQEWLAINPFPLDAWSQQLESASSDARAMVPSTLNESLDLYNHQLNDNAAFPIHGPIYSMNAPLGCSQDQPSHQRYFVQVFFFSKKQLVGWLTAVTPP